MGKKVTHLRSRAVNDALAKMTPPLHAAYLAIGQHLARGILRETRGRYEIGKLVCDVMDDEEKYGKGAVILLAVALGLKADRLYDDAKVARLWSAKEFADLVEKPDLHRMPLSFSHLVVLAEVASDERRAELVVLVRTEGLTSRDLQELTAKKKRGATAVREPGKVLRRQTQLMDSFVGGAMSVRNAAAKLVTSPEQRGLVVAALKSYEAARSEIEATVQALQEALALSPEGTEDGTHAPRGKVSGILWGAGSGVKHGGGEAPRSLKPH